MSDRSVFLITGASSGIGDATARLAARPATGWCSARARGPLEALAAELGGEERAIAVTCDVPMGAAGGAGAGALSASAASTSPSPTPASAPSEDS